MYWCAATSGECGAVIEAKWRSIINHVANVHEGHGELFPECAHVSLKRGNGLRKTSNKTTIVYVLFRCMQTGLCFQQQAYQIVWVGVSNKRMQCDCVNPSIPSISQLCTVELFLCACLTWKCV